jgi:hypothetical protein
MMMVLTRQIHQRRPAMNAFVKHHGKSIRLEYSCFDRILLNAVIPVLQQASSVVWFLKEKRAAKTLTSSYFRGISGDYHRWVEELSTRWSVPVVEPPKRVRREEWVEPFFQQRTEPGLAVILKSRENARVAVSRKTRGQPHIDMAPRFVWQYYFYAHDRDFGRMFLRICPYFPFNARFCINGHEWLACQMRKESIHFRQCGNAFLTCADPGRLQELSDEFSPRHIEACALRWLALLLPFFSDRERRREGYGHRLYMSQVEYCTNLVFHRRASLDRLMERLLDLNRTIGRPDKLSVIFGKRITRRGVSGLKTQISAPHFCNPSIRSHYKRGSIKQYVRDHLLLRTEVTSYHTPDLGVRKNVEDLTRLRQVMRPINDRYLDVQQDVLETFVDRDQLRKLAEPTVSSAGRRTPGLKLDDPRLLAVMQALVRFAHLGNGGRFRTRDLHEHVAKSLGQTTDTYKLSQLRYDLGKLRAKGLIQKIPRTQQYRLTPEGYRICVVFLKLFHRVYAPLTAASLAPCPHDELLMPKQRATLDRLYASVEHALDKLLGHIGLTIAA